MTMRSMVLIFIEGNRSFFASDAEDRGKFVGLGNIVDALQIRPSVRKGEDLLRPVRPHRLELDTLSVGQLPRFASEPEDRRMISLKHRETQRSSRCRDPKTILGGVPVVPMAVMVMMMPTTGQQPRGG